MNPFTKFVANPITKKLIGSGVRTVMAAFAADLLAPDDYELVVKAMTVLAVLAWSMFEKWTSQEKLVTALASPVPMSEASVVKKIAAGNAAPVTTAAATVPVISTS